MAVMGFRDLPQIDPGIDPSTSPRLPILERLQRGLLGPPDPSMSPAEQQAARQRGLLALGAQLMSAGGPSPTRTSFGQALGPALQAGQQAQQQYGQDLLANMLLRTKLQKERQGEKDKPPTSVQEYQFAKANGFTGSYQEWIAAGGQSSRPSSVLEWEFYNTLLEEDKKNGTKRAPMYLEMKRNPNFAVKEVNTVPTVIQPSISGTTTTPLSTKASEASAAGEKKRQESAGGALGTAQGNIQGGIETKGSNAISTQSTLDIAEPLIDVATGSQAGAARDKVAAFFGEAPDSAQAIAQLKVLQANLMTSMPRMEGPQSDRDVQLYREAAGQIGDPTIPTEIKKAAVKSIREIQNRYIERSGGQTGEPVRVTSPQDALKLPKGTVFITPDGRKKVR